MHASLFHETKTGRYEPRAIMIDSDDFVINKIGKGELKNQFKDKLFT